MARIVRASKYRHVFGTASKPEEQFVGVRPSKAAGESDLVKANSLYWACCWEAAGGGSLCVWPLNKPGKFPAKPALFSGHKSGVIDCDFHPFNEHLLASASEDCHIKMWSIPEGGLTEVVTDAVVDLVGHQRKITGVKFHPTASNILCSASGDQTVKLWDVEKQELKITLEGHTDLIQSTEFNEEGNLLATACKDKKLRVFDPRQNQKVMEADAHAGVKGMRVTWCGEKDRLLSTGFSKSSARQLGLWDPRNMAEPLHMEDLDNSAGVMMLFYDGDSNTAYVAGKGDGNVRYFEITDEAPFVHFLSEFKTAEPQRGMCMMPKRTVNVSECEIVRLLKATNDRLMPISFKVPRKADTFQEDLFPPCYAGEAGLTADEWLGGANAKPKKVSLANGFVASVHKVEFVAQKPKEQPKEATREELLEKIKALEAEVEKKDKEIEELRSKLAAAGAGAAPAAEAPSAQTPDCVCGQQGRAGSARA